MASDIFTHNHYMQTTIYRVQIYPHATATRPYNDGSSVLFQHFKCLRVDFPVTLPYGLQSILLRLKYSFAAQK